jgi:hypothetical protein
MFFGKCKSKEEGRGREGEGEGRELTKRGLLPKNSAYQLNIVNTKSLPNMLIHFLLDFDFLDIWCNFLFLRT